MGKKAKKGKKKSDFDDFFNQEKKPEDGWVSGVSAMALDESAPAAVPVADGGAADMDTAEGTRQTGAKGGVLGVNKQKMKAVRGNFTKAQKLRKSKKTEKAVARADKVVVRVSSKVAITQKKHTLKTIY